MTSPESIDRSATHADISVRVCDRAGNVYDSVTQRWNFDGLDAPKLLAERPQLDAILDTAAVTILDSDQAAVLGTELGGIVPELLAFNRESVATVLALVELCASSPSRELHVQRLADDPSAEV